MVRPTERGGTLPDAGMPSSDFSLCGPRSLRIAAGRIGISTDLRQLIGDCRTTQQGTTIQGIKEGADALGLQGRVDRLSWPQLASLTTPVVLYLNRGHFVT